MGRGRSKQLFLELFAIRIGRESKSMRLGVMFLLVVGATSLAARERTPADVELEAMQLHVARYALNSADLSERFFGTLLVDHLEGDAKTPELIALAEVVRAQAELDGANHPLILQWRMTESKDVDLRRRAAKDLADVDPNWFIVHLAQLPDTYDQTEIAIANKLIARAAASRQLGVKFGEQARNIARIWEKASPPVPSAALLDQMQANGYGTNARNLGFGVGIAIDASISIPFRPLMSWCGPEAEIKPAACARLIENLATDGSDLIVTSLATSLGYRAARNSAERERWAGRVRANEWRRDQYGQLAGKSHQDELTDLWLKEGATEQSVITEMFTRLGIPLTPPTEFFSKHLSWLKAQATDHD